MGSLGRSPFFIIVILILLPIFFQNCGDVDVSRSLSLSVSDPVVTEVAEPLKETVAEPESEPEVPVIEEPVAKVTSFSFDATAAVLSNGAFIENDDILFPPVGGAIPTRGGAQFNFTVEVAGEYFVEALVIAPGSTENSYFANVDAEPDADMAWHMPATTEFAARRLTRVDAAGGGVVEHHFLLDEGPHSLIIRRRENSMRLKELVIEKVP